MCECTGLVFFSSISLILGSFWGRLAFIQEEEVFTGGRGRGLRRSTRRFLQVVEEEVLRRKEEEDSKERRK